MAILAGIGGMIFTYILFMIIGTITPNIMNGASGTIFISTIILSGIILGSAAWIVSSLEKINEKRK